ncbi:MAG: glutamate--tRNA ligase family protein [Planctomycetaceae bacterium]
MTGLRGRLAPTPTGLLHVGHARTFALAAERAGSAGLVMRIEDLDRPRCREDFVAAALADLRWLGLDWTEGPDVGGPHGPYRQAERTAWYLDVWRRLEAAGAIYPSPHSRRDVEEAATAPHEGHPHPAFGHPLPEGEGMIANLSPLPSREGMGSNPPPLPLGEGRGEGAVAAEPDERIFPPSLRPVHWDRAAAPGGVAWRFRVPDGRVIEFHDAIQGRVRRTAGVDFGDFVVWRRDDLAAYELAVVADDHAMEIAEVVRGADLLTSTARQILLAEALGWPSPAWCHVPLVCDAAGHRLAKRTGGLAIRDLRAAGRSPDDVLAWRPG